MKIIIVISALVLYFSNCHIEAKTKKYERDYQKIFCKNLNGKIEYRLIDKTRIDCLTSEYAIEIDYGKKWAESIGQSLYYSYMTNRKAGIGIIVDLKSKSDSRYLKRLYEVTKKLNIKVFIINK
jgi:hypothetical protein